MKSWPPGTIIWKDCWIGIAKGETSCLVFRWKLPYGRGSGGRELKITRTANETGHQAAKQMRTTPQYINIQFVICIFFVYKKLGQETDMGCTSCLNTEILLYQSSGQFELRPELYLYYICIRRTRRSASLHRWYTYIHIHILKAFYFMQFTLKDEFDR